MRIQQRGMVLIARTRKGNAREVHKLEDATKEDAWVKGWREEGRNFGGRANVDTTCIDAGRSAGAMGNVLGQDAAVSSNNKQIPIKLWANREGATPARL